MSQAFSLLVCGNEKPMVALLTMGWVIYRAVDAGLMEL